MKTLEECYASIRKLCDMQVKAHPIYYRDAELFDSTGVFLPTFMDASSIS